MTANEPTTLTTLADGEMALADAAADVRGRTVIDRHAEEIGTVDALMLDESESRVRFRGSRLAAS